MSEPTASGVLRAHQGAEHATNIELFFDLVFVFAVTQLSAGLLDTPTLRGAMQAVLLLAMVWLAWAYTTWVTNWLDPERLPVRAMLLALMIGSLLLSAALPDAFGSRGLTVGCAYAGMQIGRSVFVVLVLRGERLRRNFERILVWSTVSGVLAVVGGVATGVARDWLWLGAVVVDIAGGMAGFYTPGLGRSLTTDWTIDGNHIAERCQAFLLIALGESVVVIGSAFSTLHSHGASEIFAFAAATIGAGTLWWIYFDRSADEATRVIAASDDPGRLGRSAYHLLHPIMIAGIIVTAAADQQVLDRPSGAPNTATALMILGGSALFVGGHAAFKLTVWRTVPLTRLIAVAALGLLGLLAPHVAALTLGALAGVVLLALAASDRLLDGSGSGAGDPGERPSSADADGRVASADAGGRPNSADADGRVASGDADGRVASGDAGGRVASGDAGGRVASGDAGGLG